MVVTPQRLSDPRPRLPSSGNTVISSWFGFIHRIPKKLRELRHDDPEFKCFNIHPIYTTTWRIETKITVHSRTAPGECLEYIPKLLSCQIVIFRNLLKLYQQYQNKLNILKLFVLNLNLFWSWNSQYWYLLLSNTKLIHVGIDSILESNNSCACVLSFAFEKALTLASYCLETGEREYKT